MARYLLDTDTCSCIMKRSHPALLERILAVPLSEQSVSVVSGLFEGERPQSQC